MSGPTLGLSPKMLVTCLTAASAGNSDNCSVTSETMPFNSETVLSAQKSAPTLHLDKRLNKHILIIQGLVYKDLLPRKM